MAQPGLGVSRPVLLNQGNKCGSGHWGDHEWGTGRQCPYLLSWSPGRFHSPALHLPSQRDPGLGPPRKFFQSLSRAQRATLNPARLDACKKRSFSKIRLQFLQEGLETQAYTNAVFSEWMHGSP
jgi:hypothetical protein